MTSQRVIAIDGPSGVGKSTLAERLAGRLGWLYLDTGAMYRCCTLAWLATGSDPSKLRDRDWLAGLDIDLDGQRFLLGGRDVSQEIRSAEVTQTVSLVSSVEEVRRILTEMQRAFGRRQACVLDGRDIGTVVFPDAFFKVFLVASSQVRARRRWLELGGPQSAQTLDEIKRAIDARDARDASRSLAPLRQAADAWELETDGLTIDQVVTRTYDEARRRLRALDHVGG